MIDKSYICTKCNTEFKQHGELAQHIKGCKGITVTPQSQVIPTPTPKPEPIALTYLYKGKCNTCSGPLTTLELDVESKHFCIALCNRCSKQCETKEVVKL